MKPFRQRSLAFVSGLAMVFASFGTVPAAAERDPYETPIIPVGPTDPNVVFDKNTGVLTLKGKIDKEDVRAYAGNDEVESVIAEDTAVFPADCSELFRDFRALSFDIVKADTSAVTDMSWMFRDCTQAVSVTLSDYKTFIDTSNVTTMKGMFSRCSSLGSISLYGINTANAENFSGMFHYCSELKSIDIYNFNISKASNLSGMFSGCTKLASLDLSSFDTGNVKYLHQTFMGCAALKSLDLSSFDTASATDFRELFAGCTGLERIFVSDGWTVPKGSISTDMFKDCTAVAGGRGTAFDAEHTDSSYARIDRKDAPGYFSEKFRLSLGGTVVTDCNCGDILGDGSARYDSDSRTLTLSNDLNDCFISSGIDGLTVYAEGDINISSGSTAMIFRAPAVISGSGRLTVSSGSAGITADSLLTFEKAEVIVDSGLGIIGGGEGSALKIINSELTVSAPYSEAAVTGFGSVTLEKCSVVSPEGAYFSGGIPVVSQPDPEDPTGSAKVPVNELTVLPEGVPVDSAELTLTVPEAFVAPDFTVSSEAELECSLSWYCGEKKLTAKSTFAAGTECTAVIRLTPAEGFRLTRNTAVTVLGQPAERTAVYSDGSAEYSISYKVPYKYMLGDVNGDGALNMKDLATLQRYVNGWDIEISIENADLTGEGKVNMKDVAALQRLLNSI